MLQRRPREKDGKKMSPRKQNFKKRLKKIALQKKIKKRLKKDGPPKYPEHQTPWQEIYRNHVGHMSDGGVLENAVAYQKVKNSLPRDNH